MKRSDPIDRAIEWLLIGLLAFMPLAFGAVEAWSEEVVLVLTAALSGCFLLRCLLARRGDLIWSWTYVPVLAFVALVVMQLVPWPVGWLRVVAPGTVSLKTELLEDLPQSATLLAHMAISFYAYGTRHDLRLVLAATSLFVVVLNVFRRPEQIDRLLGAIATIGGLFALLAVAQTLFGNGRIYWLVATPGGAARSGPFINHSHYGQFMNLCVGAALGLVFVRFREVFSRGRIQPGGVADYLGSRAAGPLWMLLAVVVLGIGTVFLSLTREGMISTLVAMAFTAAALSFNRALRRTGWIMAVLALGAFTCVLYLGFDAVYDRLGTLSRLEPAQGSRGQILRDVAVAWTRFPLWGTGLGTHEVVYPMFDRSTVPELAAFAENEYAQSAEETGLAGLAALVVFGVLIGGCYRRATRSQAAPICAAAYGLGFGLVAILVHSLSDFGQHVPANAMLSAVFCALLVRLSRPERASPAPTPDAPARRWAGVLQIIGLVGVIGLWGWALLGADAARVGAAHWAQVTQIEQSLAGRQWQGGDETYALLLGSAARAREADPGNVKYCHWLNTFRWRAISRTMDAGKDAGFAPARERELTARIVDELNQARALCPTFGPSWIVLGQLEKYVLGRGAEGARHIHTGVRLAPCDPTARLVAAALDAEAGAVASAVGHLQKAVRLNEESFDDAVALLAGSLNRPDLARQVAGDDVHRLARQLIDGLSLGASGGGNWRPSP